MGAKPHKSFVQHWMIGSLIALSGHLAVGAIVLSQAPTTSLGNDIPVVMLELPEAPVAEKLAEPTAKPEPLGEPLPATKSRPVSRPKLLVPPVPVPLHQAVATPIYEPVPEPANLPQQSVYIPPAQPTYQQEAKPIQQTAIGPRLPAPPYSTPPQAQSSAISVPKKSAVSANERAKKADYYVTLSRHLNRKKKYPRAAKKAREEGIVKVRFTVSRNGSVSNVSVKKSSGYELLDSETIALLQRAAPLPRMPKSMTRDSVTITLPIEYSLKTR